MKTATPTASATATADPTSTSSHDGAQTVPHATEVSLCVEIARSQASSVRGHAAQWTVSAWTAGGNVSAATLKLQASPASGGAAGFSFGCGSADGTSSCDLGTVDAKSAPRQLQAQLTVPVTASTVTSVKLTVTGSATGLTKDPKASATVSITAPPAANAASQSTPPQNPATVPAAPVTVTSPLPVGSLPSIPAVSSTLSPGGNAANLFPTLDPTPTTDPAQSTQKARTRPVADTSAMPEGDAVVGAQLAGLAALALAFVLAVTRLSVRRRPASGKASADSAPAKESPAQESPAKESNAPESKPAPKAGQPKPQETPAPNANNGDSADK